MQRANRSYPIMTFDPNQPIHFLIESGRLLCDAEYRDVPATTVAAHVSCNKCILRGSVLELARNDARLHQPVEMFLCRKMNWADAMTHVAVLLATENDSWAP